MAEIKWEKGTLSWGRYENVLVWWGSIDGQWSMYVPITGGECNLFLLKNFDFIGPFETPEAAMLAAEFMYE